MSEVWLSRILVEVVIQAHGKRTVGFRVEFDSSADELLNLIAPDNRIAATSDASRLDPIH